MAVARPQSLLSCLLFFIIGAIWLQSLHADFPFACDPHHSSV